jgi:hypothetical protein
VLNVASWPSGVDDLGVDDAAVFQLGRVLDGEQRLVQALGEGEQVDRLLVLAALDLGCLAQVIGPVRGFGGRSSITGGTWLRSAACRWNF